MLAVRRRALSCCKVIRWCLQCLLSWTAASRRWSLLAIWLHSTEAFHTRWCLLLPDVLLSHQKHISLCGWVPAFARGVVFLLWFRPFFSVLDVYVLFFITNLGQKQSMLLLICVVFSHNIRHPYIQTFFKFSHGMQMSYWGWLVTIYHSGKFLG